MARHLKAAEPDGEPGRRSMGRLRFQTGLAVLFTAMGTMVGLVALDVLLPGGRGRELVGDAFEAFKLIAVTVLGYIFGANQTKTGPEQ